MNAAAYIDNANYLNDPRVIAATRPDRFDSVDETSMTGVFRLGDDSYTIGVKYEVCGLCRGTGTHGDPSVDAGGFNPDDQDEGWLERYFDGSYDVICSECVGHRVVPVPMPRDAAERAVLKKLEQWQEEMRAGAALNRAELLAGA